MDVRVWLLLLLWHSDVDSDINRTGRTGECDAGHQKKECNIIIKTIENKQKLRKSNKAIGRVVVVVVVTGSRGIQTNTTSDFNALVYFLGDAVCHSERFDFSSTSVVFILVVAAVITIIVVTMTVLLLINNIIRVLFLLFLQLLILLLCCCCCSFFSLSLSRFLLQFFFISFIFFPSFAFSLLLSAMLPITSHVFLTLQLPSKKSHRDTESTGPLMIWPIFALIVCSMFHSLCIARACVCECALVYVCLFVCLR